MKQENMGFFRMLVIADLILVKWQLLEPDDGSGENLWIESLDEGVALILGILLLAALAGWFISLIGLLMLKNWARWIYLASLVVLLAVSIRATGFYETFWSTSLARIETIVMIQILYISHVSRPDAFD